MTTTYPHRHAPVGADITAHARDYVAKSDELRTGRFPRWNMLPMSGLPHGMAMVPVSKCTDGDRVSGPSDFTGGYSPDEVAHDVQELYAKVLPSIASGEDLAGVLRGFDAGADRDGGRSLSDTFFGFFGESAISVDLLDDGTFWVTNGARRVWVARRLGITHLPARVTHSC